jgi:hypothetical protein
MVLGSELLRAGQKIGRGLRLMTHDTPDSPICRSIPNAGFVRIWHSGWLRSPLTGASLALNPALSAAQTASVPLEEAPNDGQWTMPAKNYAAMRISASSQSVACCDVVNRGAVYSDGKVFFNTLDGRGDIALLQRPNASLERNHSKFATTLGFATVSRTMNRNRVAPPTKRGLS